MNTQRVIAAALSSIVLAFSIKGYYILHYVDGITHELLHDDTLQTATLHHNLESFESFLYLASVLLVVIVAPFITKFKSINKQ